MGCCGLLTLEYFSSPLSSVPLKSLQFHVSQRLLVCTYLPLITLVVLVSVLDGFSSAVHFHTYLRARRKDQAVCVLLGCQVSIAPDTFSWLFPGFSVKETELRESRQPAASGEVGANSMKWPDV